MKANKMTLPKRFDIAVQLLEEVMSDLNEAGQKAYRNGVTDADMQGFRNVMDALETAANISDDADSDVPF